MWNENKGHLQTIQDYYDFIKSRNLFKDCFIEENNCMKQILIKVVLNDEYIDKYVMDKLCNNMEFFNEIYSEIRWWSPMWVEIKMEIVNNLEC